MRGLPRRTLALLAAMLLALAAAAPGLAGVSPGTPLATDDAYSASEDAVLDVDAPGLLENDNPGSGTCVADVDTTGTVGQLQFEPDGAFTFTPAQNWHGQTTFTYSLRVEGGGDCSGPADSEATVTITVEPVNDAPTAVADSFLALPNRTLNVNAPGVLLNDSDIDGDTLTATKVTNPAHGIAILAADGSFSYTPSAGYVGPDTFSYRASDGTDVSAARVVSLTVSAVPTPVPTATPAPTPTAAPSAAATLEPSPSGSPEPSPSVDPFASPSGLPTSGPSASPGASPVPGEVADAGGLSIPVLVGGLLLASLLAFGAAVYVPKWLESRRTGEPMDDGE